MDDRTVPAKRCPRCGESKPATPDAFPRNSAKPDGLGSWCKACFNSIASAKRGPKKPKPSTTERFWARVDKDGPIAPGMATACWISSSGRDKNGYARFFVPERRNNMGAHAYSWALHHGAVADGLQVNHKCDVPTCVNPGHLYLGTQAENMRDRDNRGRQARGERGGNSKLSEAEVIGILRMAASGSTQTATAAAFGISIATVNNIVLRKTWRHVADDGGADAALEADVGRPAQRP